MVRTVEAVRARGITKCFETTLALESRGQPGRQSAVHDLRLL